MRNVETMLEIIGAYFGGNPLLLLAILGFMVLWKKVSKKNRIYMTVICVCGAVFVYNDLMYKLAQVVGEGSSFYRVLWIVPVVGLCAYLCIEVYTGLKQGTQRMAAILLAVVMLFLYGSNSISNWTTLPENIYQIPNEVVAVADIIEADSGGARVNFCDEDDELSNLIRQYNANICWPVEYTSYLNYIWSDNAIDVSGRQIRSIVRNSQVDYLAIKVDRVDSQRALESGGCREVGRTAEHVVYATDATWWAEYEAKEQAVGVYDAYWTNFESINIPGMSGMKQFLYLNPSHAKENEALVEEWTTRVADFELEQIFLGNNLEGNAGTEAFQMLSYEDFLIVSVDNSEEVLNQDVLKKYDEAQALGKPIILMLREPLSLADSEDELLKRVLAEDSTVCFVFATDAETYKKELLSDEIVQCAGFPEWLETTETMIVIRGQ